MKNRNKKFFLKWFNINSIKYAHLDNINILF